MKPDFNNISLKDFREYLKANRNDSEAWDIYYVRMDRESSRVNFPCPANPEDIRQAIESNSELKAKFGG